MKNRVLGIISIITNLLLVGLVALGIVSLFVPIFPSTIQYPFYQFQILTSCLVGFFALIGVVVYFKVAIKNKPVVSTAFQVFKLMSVVCSGIVLIASFVYLLPTYSGNWKDVFGDANLIFRLFVPVLCIASYGFFEIHKKMKWRYTFLGILPAILYYVFYIVWFFLKKGTGVPVDWYEFGFKEGNWTKVAIGSLIVLGVSYGLSFIIWLFNKFFHFIVYGYEYHDKDIPETPMYSAEIIEAQEEEAEKASVEEKIESIDQANSEVINQESSLDVSNDQEIKTTKRTRKSIPAGYGKYDGRARVYHISRSKFIGGQWQVKLANGEKAIKLFPTQKEAIEFAKQLVWTQGGSIRIHSMKGQMRK